MSTLAKWVAGSKHFNMSLHQLINNKVLYSFRIEILPDADFPIKNLLFLLYVGPSVCWMFCRTKTCGDWVNTKLPEATGLAAPKRKGNLVPLYSQPSYLSVTRHVLCAQRAARYFWERGFTAAEEITICGAILKLVWQLRLSQCYFNHGQP